MNKWKISLLAAVLAGGAGLLFQHRAVTRLTQANADLQQKLERAAQANADLMAARKKADQAVARLLNRTAPAPARQTLASAAAPAPRPAVDDPARKAEKERIHHEYDLFFRRQGLTAEQGERVAELIEEQAEARADLQAGVVAAGGNGGAAGIEDLRSQLYAPILQEMRSILGDGGYAAYAEYQKTYYYQAITQPLTTMLASANAALSDEQAEQLAGVVGTNDHPWREKPTDIGSRTRIDWDAVVAVEASALTPAQLAVLRAYADQQKATPAPAN